MAMTAVALRSLEGEEYENVFMKELMNFKDSQLGVDANDIDAALILRDEGEMKLLKRLHDRRIHVIGKVDDLSTFSELEFEAVGHEQ
jgi:hypothetical protein